MSPAGGHIAAIARAVALSHKHNGRHRSVASNGSGGSARRPSSQHELATCSSVGRPPPPTTISTDSGVRAAWRDDHSSILQSPMAVPSVSTPSYSDWQPFEARGYYNKFRSPPPLPPGSDRRLLAANSHKRWLRHNRVGHGSSASYQLSRLKYRATPGAAVLLYLGLGIIVVGLVITFVGVGDHAFQTLELQLIGPTLIMLGFLLIGLRVLICAFAGRCSHCDKPINKAVPSTTNGVSLGEFNRGRTKSSVPPVIASKAKRGPGKKEPLPSSSTSSPSSPPTRQPLCPRTLPLTPSLREQDEDNMKEYRTRNSSSVNGTTTENSDAEDHTVEVLVSRKSTQAALHCDQDEPQPCGSSQLQRPVTSVEDDVDSLSEFLEVVLKQVEISEAVSGSTSGFMPQALTMDRRNSSPLLTPSPPPLPLSPLANSSAKFPRFPRLQESARREIILDPGSLVS